MRYNYKITYSDWTTEKNVYSLAEEYIYKAVEKARKEYLKHHDGVSVTKIIIISVR